MPGVCWEPVAAHRLLPASPARAESWRRAQRLQLPQIEKLLWNPWGGKLLKIHEGSVLGKRRSSSEEHGPRAPESPAQCVRPLPSTLMSEHRSWTLTALQCHPGKAARGHSSRPMQELEPKLMPELGTGAGKHKKQNPAQLICQVCGHKAGQGKSRVSDQTFSPGL